MSRKGFIASGVTRSRLVCIPAAMFVLRNEVQDGTFASLKMTKQTLEASR